MKRRRRSALVISSLTAWFFVGDGFSPTTVTSAAYGGLKQHCTPLPGSVGEDLVLLGSGHCADNDGLTPRAYGCNDTSSPDCALVGDLDACALQCLKDAGCTGFELRTNQTLRTTECRVFFHFLPPAPWTWTVLDNGTQSVNSSRRAVATVTLNDDDDVCCYKRTYPRPCPKDNPVPVPPKQSDRAQEIFARMNAKAATASAGVLPNLTRMIEFCSANAVDGGGLPQVLFGADMCPGMADLTDNGTVAAFPSATDILRRFSEEFRVAEFGHGYAPLYTVQTLMSAYDVVNTNFPFVPNLFVPPTLGLNVTNPPTIPSYDPIMKNIFGCDNFTGDAAYTLDFREAADRITYTALNWVHSPVGNIINYVGLFDAVLRPSYVRDMMLVTPTDSGHYEAEYPNCVGWPDCTVGTIDNIYHILYAWMTGGGQTGGPYTPSLVPANCASQMNMIRQLTCSLQPNRENPHRAVPPNPIEYFEMDALGIIRYPEGVKFITASFKDYFGTAFGQLIRNWCLHWKWAMVWVLHDGTNPLDARRLLDPTVLAGSTLNVSLDPTFQASFDSMWTVANASRAKEASKWAEYETTWVQFVNTTNTAGISSAVLWTMGLRDCEDHDQCIGVVNATGKCACYRGH